MAAEVAPLVASLILAGVLGFAARRANICNVKAVEEVLATRRAFIFASLAKTVLWAMVVTLVLVYAMPGGQAPTRVLSISLVSIAGAFVCGFGMAINGGCAFGTLSRLGAGDAAMLVTLGAFVAGVMAMTTPVIGFWTLAPARVVPSPFDLSDTWSAALLGVLCLWAAWELIRLFRTRPREQTAVRMVTAHTYRLSSAAVLMGLANGLIFAINGDWAYTNTLGQGARRLTEFGPAPTPTLWGLFAALFVGMCFSSWQRGGIRLLVRPNLSWSRNLVGGFLMGVGAALVPGGNDALLLYGIPNLSLHAMSAYLAMVVGITAFLILARLGGAEVATVDCRADLCEDR